MQYLPVQTLSESPALPPSPSVCCALPLPALALSLCVSVVWALSQVECVFLNEYLMRLMRLAGGGAVSVEYCERKKEEGGRGRGREAETHTE